MAHRHGTHAGEYCNCITSERTIQDGWLVDYCTQCGRVLNTSGRA